MDRGASCYTMYELRVGLRMSGGESKSEGLGFGILGFLSSA